jgi:hypothetical protein
LQRARISGALGDEAGVREDLAAGQRAWTAAGDPRWPDDHYQIDRAKVAYFGSGAMVGLRKPREAIELASEVIEANDNPATRNWWPMRVANARLELATARADLGEEDEAASIAEGALDPQWFRPDTERRTRILLRRMRDSRLRALVSDRLAHARTVAADSGLTAQLQRDGTNRLDKRLRGLYAHGTERIVWDEGGRDAQDRGGIADVPRRGRGVAQRVGLAQVHERRNDPGDCLRTG